MVDKDSEIDLSNFKFDHAFWVDRDHTRFHVDVTTSNGGLFPFTYVADGSDDNDSDVSRAVSLAYKQNAISILEYPESLDLYKRLNHEQDIRAKRNNLLSNTDHLIQSDYPISDEKKQEIKAYRQALRDIPQQDGFPENIVWPDKPVI